MAGRRPIGDRALTSTERSQRTRTAKANAAAVAAQQGADHGEDGDSDAKGAGQPVNPKDAASLLQLTQDAVQYLRYGRTDMEEAFTAGTMFGAAQQALGGAAHLRGVVDEWVGSGPPLLWQFQVALSGSPWAEEAEAAGWLGGSLT